MSAHTYTTSQLILAEHLRDLEGLCRSIGLVLGPGQCRINPCEACAMERQIVSSYAQEAMALLHRLTHALQDMGVIPEDAPR